MVRDKRPPVCANFVQACPRESTQAPAHTLKSMARARNLFRAVAVDFSVT